MLTYCYVSCDALGFVKLCNTIVKIRDNVFCTGIQGMFILNSTYRLKTEIRSCVGRPSGRPVSEEIDWASGGCRGGCMGRGAEDGLLAGKHQARLLPYRYRSQMRHRGTKGRHVSPIDRKESITELKRESTHDMA